MAAARLQANAAARAASRGALSQAARTRLQAMRAPTNQARPVPTPSSPTVAAVSKPQSPVAKDFGNPVLDKVAAQNPLLAESPVVPREPERDALFPPPTEMAQSFDSVPSVKNVASNKKVRQSKTVSLQEETMEAVNFLNLINLRLLP